MRRTKMVANRRWTIAPPQEGVHELARRLRVAPIVAQIMLNRGIRGDEECMQFLSPSPKMLHDPGLLPGATAAAERIAAAIRGNESIVIYGDYDVDGITASSILWHAIKTLGGGDAWVGRVSTYVPHRIDEGYGLNAEALKQICAGGANLIISVDCGVTAVGPAKAVREIGGVDLIITDHHEMHVGVDGNVELPDCHTVVHPRLPGSEYPNGNLCGAGVAFKLAWAIGRAMHGSQLPEDYKQFLREATALCALGTIADVVPLVGENRVIAAYGLRCLKETRLTGLRALLAGSRLLNEKLDAYDIGFKLAPRLNACGRMGHAKLASELLTVATEARAMEIATFLDQQNRERQATEKKIVQEALEEVERINAANTAAGLPDLRVIVVGKPGWHPGVIGIVASRLVDRFCKPAIVVAMGEELGLGSARSVPGFHLAEALAACTTHLVSHGGHEMAAGLKVKPEEFAAFSAAMAEYARQHVTDDMLRPEVKLECDVALSSVSLELVKEMGRLGPFGQGNRKPLLACRKLELVADPRVVGKDGGTLQLQVRQGQALMKAVAFNSAALWVDKLKRGMLIDLAFEPSLNEYNGFVNVELQVKDIRICPESGGAVAEPDAAAVEAAAAVT